MNYPNQDKKVIGKFRFRYFCLFELYTFDTHDEQSHEGYTIDLTFPIPDEDDELTPIRTEAFNRIKKYSLIDPGQDHIVEQIGITLEYLKLQRNL